jgi:hypothetical protein
VAQTLRLGDRLLPLARHLPTVLLLLLLRRRRRRLLLQLYLAVLVLVYRGL